MGCGYKQSLLPGVATTQRQTALARVQIPEERGEWLFGNCPERVLIDNRHFKLAEWRNPAPGVKCQYREDVERHSRHMYVLEGPDGNPSTFMVNHVDNFNPDVSFPYAVAHLAADVPTAGTWIGLGIGALALTMILTGVSK